MTLRHPFAQGGCMLKRQSVWTRIILGCLSVILLASPVPAQSFYGALISVVKDSQGLVIPGANIVLLNTATNERRGAGSAEEGTHRFVNPRPRPHKPEVERAGVPRSL